jgi:hypothetical protein
MENNELIRRGPWRDYKCKASQPMNCCVYLIKNKNGVYCCNKKEKIFNARNAQGAVIDCRGVGNLQSIEDSINLAYSIDRKLVWKSKRLFFAKFIKSCIVKIKQLVWEIK